MAEERVTDAEQAAHAGGKGAPAPISYEQANALQRFNRRFAATGPGSWFLSSQSARG